MPTPRSIGLALLIALPLPFLAGAALAQASGPSSMSAGDAGARDEAAALSAQIAHEDESLSTSDCAAACRALASMSRAADRLCALGPGPSCDGARARVDAATQRVRAACPECVTVGTTERAAAPTMAEETVAVRRGGCASCTASSAREPGGLALGVGAAFVAAGIARRRRRGARRAESSRAV